MFFIGSYHNRSEQVEKLNLKTSRRPRSGVLQDPSGLGSVFLGSCRKGQFVEGTPCYHWPGST